MGRKRHNLVKICEQCQVQFEARQPSGKPNPKLRFCSRSCSMRYAGSRRPKQNRTPEWNKKIGDAQRGRLAKNWQGGVTPQQKLERLSPEYKRWRTAIFERDNYTCTICGKRGGILNADHIKGWIKYPELRFDLNNGRTLCIDCHKKTPNYARNRKYQL